MQLQAALQHAKGAQEEADSAMQLLQAAGAEIEDLRRQAAIRGKHSGVGGRSNDGTVTASASQGSSEPKQPSTSHEHAQQHESPASQALRAKVAKLEEQLERTKTELEGARKSTSEATAGRRAMDRLKEQLEDALSEAQLLRARESQAQEQLRELKVQARHAQLERDEAKQKAEVEADAAKQAST